VKRSSSAWNIPIQAYHKLAYEMAAVDANAPTLGFLLHEVAPCNHLALFMGMRTLEEYWPRIVRWMKEVD